MRGFGSFVRKEMLHILRDRRTMLIVLLMPVVQMLLFGFAISTEVNNVDFAVVAPKRSESIRQQVERLSANDYFTFKGYIVPQSIDEVLRCGEVDAVVVFADDYDRRMNALAHGESDQAAVQLIFDASNPNVAASGSGYMRNVLQSDGISVSMMPETDEACVQFRTGDYGVDFSVDLCDDDLDLHCQGEGVRHYGGAARFASASVMDHFGQNDPLFFTVVYQSVDDSVVGPLCVGGSDDRFHDRADRYIPALYFVGLGIGVVYFDHCQDPGGGHVDFRNGVDFAGDYAFGDGLPGGEYARNFAGGFLCDSGPLVYRGDA